MTVWALQDNIAFSFTDPILTGLSSHADTHIYRTYCKHIFPSIHTYPHTRSFFFFFLNLFSDTHFSLFKKFYTEEVRVCWRQRKPRRAGEGNSKDVCVVWKCLFGLVLGLQLNTSSNFHHYYPALWQGDLSVLLTIRAHNKFTCRGWSHMKKYDPTGRNAEEVSRVKEKSCLSVLLAHGEMCLLVKVLHEMMDW